MIRIAISSAAFEAFAGTLPRLIGPAREIIGDARRGVRISRMSPHAEAAA